MIRQPLVRFAVAGLVRNGVLYCAYLLLNRGLMGSRATMTITDSAAVLFGFLLSRKESVTLTLPVYYLRFKNIGCFPGESPPLSIPARLLS
jgi:hypothetical protein